MSKRAISRKKLERRGKELKVVTSLDVQQQSSAAKRRGKKFYPLQSFDAIVFPPNRNLMYKF